MDISICSQQIPQILFLKKKTLLDTLRIEFIWAFHLDHLYKILLPQNFLSLKLIKGAPKVSTFIYLFVMEESLWLAHCQFVWKIGYSPRVEVERCFHLAYLYYNIYVYKSSTLAKTYEIKKYKCYWEHFGEHIGNRKKTKRKSSPPLTPHPKNKWVHMSTWSFITNCQNPEWFGCSGFDGYHWRKHGGNGRLICCHPHPGKNLTPENNNNNNNTNNNSNL